ncbi:hypothetical protein MalM14_14980 [Gimesia chilikensis]|nr:hypothetical protein MalM14_14980 [Gimesia chilikensis]
MAPEPGARFDETIKKHAENRRKRRIDQTARLQNF